MDDLNQTPATSPTPKTIAESEVPSYGFSIHSLRDEMKVIFNSSHDLRVLNQLLEDDPSLEKLREHNLLQNPGVKDISPELASLIVKDIKGLFSKEAEPALSFLIDFYFGYLRPFPDVTETEPLQSLVGYISDLETWDVLAAKDEKSKKITGACSGQIVDVPCDAGDFKTGWNEHTWVGRENRRKGLGGTLADLFGDKVIDHGAVGAVIEMDNPHLITDDPRAFVADVIARSNFWTDTVEGLGQSMDPFNRAQFWGNKGFSIMCYMTDDGPVPMPYSQISMILGIVGSCETINAASRASDKKYENFWTCERYEALYVALQKTIDPDAASYPEAVRTLNQIEAIAQLIGKDTPLVLVRLDDPRLPEIQARAKASKENYAQQDLEYCNQRLQVASISEREREILEKSQEYLKNSLST